MARLGASCGDVNPACVAAAGNIGDIKSDTVPAEKGLNGLVKFAFAVFMFMFMFETDMALAGRPIEPPIAMDSGTALCGEDAGLVVNADTAGVTDGFIIALLDPVTVALAFVFGVSGVIGV